ncbi:MAG: MarR family winged helix-turn-helix transcriptional regulator, partial [Kiloniellales bacterium]
QHIQGLVDRLLAACLVEYVDNPAHRRSKLVRATEAGRGVFAGLREREEEAFARLPLDLGAEELDEARGVLATLIDVFQGADWQAVVDDLSTKPKE